MDGSTPIAAAPPAIAPGLRAVGYVERLDAEYLTGWAWIPEDPATVVQVEVLVGGRPALRLDADGFRPDLLAAGRGTGRYGFSFQAPRVLLEAGRELVSVRLADGGGELQGSPRWVQAPELGLDQPTLRFIAAALESAARSAARPEELDPVLALLAGQLAQVAQARAALREEESTALDELAALGEAAGPVPALAQQLRERFPPIHGLRTAETPRVSVVIPAHGRFDLTYACIAAIAEAGAAAPFEIVLVDDGSADETLLADFVFDGAVRVVRTRRNAGFLHAANRGAAAARGEYLLFLNNDTEVQEGWLDALLATFEADPAIGIAGAKLILPDGTLQEAGGIVGRFGEAANWGRGEDPEDPRFCYLRDADYVSGAALMIPRALFGQLGGFDPEFAPGYYEDTDLCFRVRHRLGRRVVVQPLARVIHHEGGTAGTDTATGPKRAQLANQRRFHRRWRDVLETHRRGGEAPHLDAERHVVRRAFFIDEVVPTPDRDAGSGAALAHMRLLQRLGYKVTFMAASSPEPRPGYTEALQGIGIECLHAPHVRSVEEGLRRQAVPPDFVYLHRGSVAAKYLGLVREHVPEARIAYSVADLHFLRLRREAEVTGDAARIAEAARLEAMELQAARNADRVIVHSPVEAALLAETVPGLRVHVVPWTVRVVRPEVPVAARRGVCFLGGYAHRPNLDAAFHLMQAVMPLVWQELPDLPCLLAGSDMPAELRALAAGPVEALGHVPDLARGLFDRVRCSVAPLRYGAGIKGKVLQSLAHGLPCVMTPIAAEGLPLPETLAALVAETPEAMAAHILALHRDNAQATAVSDAALGFAEATYGEDAVLRQFAAAVSDGWEAASATARP